MILSNGFICLIKTKRKRGPDDSGPLFFYFLGFLFFLGLAFFFPPTLPPILPYPIPFGIVRSFLILPCVAWLYTSKHY